MSSNHWKYCRKYVWQNPLSRCVSVAWLKDLHDLSIPTFREVLAYEENIPSSLEQYQISRLETVLAPPDGRFEPVNSDWFDSPAEKHYSRHMTRFNHERFPDIYVHW